VSAAFDEIDVPAAAERVRGVVRRTALVPGEVGEPRLELRLKLECTQVTGSFKARGAWNNVAQLDDEQRARGVVATSSGNHGRALAWAAERAGVPATIFMPEDAYANKIEACTAHGATVDLSPTRNEAEERCAAAVAAGAVLIHPYDAPRTCAGAGTVGLEVAEDWPRCEVLVVPVGGGGLIGGSSLAFKGALGDGVTVIGVEPAGSPNLSAARAAGAPVVIDPITTRVQGLCPLDVGAINLALAQAFVNEVVTLEDDAIFDAQARLVRAGLSVEPAGAATFAAVLAGALPAHLLERRTTDDPLRVACVVSGGNADPDQLAGLR
jgi:threonine dehydratase